MSIFTGIKTGAFSSYPDERTRGTEWHCPQSLIFQDLPTLSVEWQAQINFLDEHGMKEPRAAVGSFNRPGYNDSLTLTSQPQPSVRPSIAPTPRGGSSHLTSSPESSTPRFLSNHPTPQDSFNSSSSTLVGSPSTDVVGEVPRYEVGDIVQVRKMVLGTSSKERQYEAWINGIVVEADEYPNFDLAEEYAYQVKYYSFNRCKFQTALFYPSYDQIRAPINNATAIPLRRIRTENCSSRRCCQLWKTRCLELGGKPLEVKRGSYVFFQTLTRSSATAKRIWVPGRCISANDADSEYWIEAVGGPDIGREYWTQGPFKACTSESLEHLINGKATLDLHGWDYIVRCSCS